MRDIHRMQKELTEINLCNGKVGFLYAALAMLRRLNNVYEKKDEWVTKTVEVLHETIIKTVRLITNSDSTDESAKVTTV
jgi:hypothetical protein